MFYTTTLHRIIRIPCPFPPMLSMPLLVSQNSGSHVIHHGVDAERWRHQKQVVNRQSHATINISNIMIQMHFGYQLKKGNKRLYLAKIICEVQLCATAATAEFMLICVPNQIIYLAYELLRNIFDEKTDYGFQISIFFRKTTYGLWKLIKILYRSQTNPKCSQVKRFLR